MMKSINGSDGINITSGNGGSGSSSSNVGKRIVVRQVLTARRGQRPSAWMDFNDMREVMLGWEGYKVIAVGSDAGLGGI